MNEVLSKVIDQRQLVSVMNKTKWRELCSLFADQGDASPEVRYKLIYEDKILGFSKVWWDELFGDSVAIEWIDFDSYEHEFRGRLVSDKDTDISSGILEVLHKFNIPYSIEGKYYRVWGYINADSNPEFV
ncbi:hypothetical protein P3339_18910 [Microbulbifer sp. MLAF003]|uniref:DUF6678 family protein n=1 Tax=unclassified Microbulbifer TaxID=2619833 RepID=UPI0024ACE4F0|nr:DUF6678 family protein [Microbulbifer sp. MLAF003]WHI50488.1 hypothetical protein P3339_18910 [Microbulbifer sp. MLAF003]